MIEVLHTAFQEDKSQKSTTVMSEINCCIMIRTRKGVEKLFDG